MNYFEYFSEVEERFSSRRGSLLLLSTLDWALIETWREAGIPLAAVLRGIDAAFDRYEARKARSKGRLSKVNGLAWCAQAVMQAAAEMADAAIGGQKEGAEQRATGFEGERVARFLSTNAEVLEHSPKDACGSDVRHATATRLRALAAEVLAGSHTALDDLDRVLTVLEERLEAVLLAGLSEEALVTARAAADAEMAPFRARLGAVQMRQVREQLMQRRLFQQQRIPRLSLFYMPVEEGSDASEEHGTACT